jgi:hypothetical protein
MAYLEAAAADDDSQYHNHHYRCHNDNFMD